MGLLDGRVAVVTGAGRGIGRDIARCLASKGRASSSTTSGRVSRVKARRTTGLGDGRVDRGGGRQGRCERRIRLGLRGRAPAHRQAVDTFGRIDILVNNAGIVRDRRLLKMEEGDYDAVIAVHQKGHLQLHPSRRASHEGARATAGS